MFIRYGWEMHDTGMIYAWDMNEICMWFFAINSIFCAWLSYWVTDNSGSRDAMHLKRIWLQNAWNMIEICLIHVLDKPQKCLIYAWNTLNICWRFFQNPPKVMLICLRYFSSEIFLSYVFEIPEIYLKYA